MNYKEDINLNKNDLDNEWEKQSSLVLEYGHKLAYVTNKKERLKEKMKIYSSDLELRIRENPSNHGLTKVTEAGISASLSTDPTIKTYNQEIMEVSEEIGLLSIAMKAFEHKRAALDGLTKLTAQHYYSESSSDMDTKAKITDKTNEKAGKAQKAPLEENKRLKKTLKRRIRK